MNMAGSEKTDMLVGPCGLYCGICTMYRAYHDRNLSLWQETPVNFRKQIGLEEVDFKDMACEGCRSALPFKYCADCNIRKCVLEDKGLDWCYQCESFPCQMLLDFQSYWRMPVVENLRQIQKLGLDIWLKQQDEKWRCSQCGTKLHWFSFGICPGCGGGIADPGSK